MATHTEHPELGADVLSLLAQLRRRIRMYVWVEGLSLALLWLGTTFWIGLAIDYLPVLMGASEMPRVPRLVLLAVIAAILAYVLYRWVFQRAFARLPDHSMAVLLERRFDRFQRRPGHRRGNGGASGACPGIQPGNAAADPSAGPRADPRASLSATCFA